MSVAFDPDKEARNIVKHGISLVRAEEIDMASAIVREDDSKDVVRIVGFALAIGAPARLSHAA